MTLKSPDNVSEEPLEHPTFTKSYVSVRAHAFVCFCTVCGIFMCLCMCVLYVCVFVCMCACVLCLWYVHVFIYDVCGVWASLYCSAANAVGHVGRERLW